MSQIKEIYQKFFVVVMFEEGSIIFGFFEVYFINYDEYWIYYQECLLSWFDLVWWSFVRFFGKRLLYKVFKVNKKIVQFNNEIIIVYCKMIEEIVGIGQ